MDASLNVTVSPFPTLIPRFCVPQVVSKFRIIDFSIMILAVDVGVQRFFGVEFERFIAHFAGYVLVVRVVARLRNDFICREMFDDFRVLKWIVLRFRRGVRTATSGTWMR